MEQGKISTKDIQIFGNRVMIGCGAKILGPIQIGDDTKIGAGAVILKSIEQGKVVVGVPGKKVEKKTD